MGLRKKSWKICDRRNVLLRRTIGGRFGIGLLAACGGERCSPAVDGDSYVELAGAAPDAGPE